MKRTIVLLLSCLLFIGCISLPVSAAEAPEIMPYYNNVMKTSSSFSIDASGTGTVKASYAGFSGVTESVTVTIKIQKKTLGLVWTKVDIGVPNNEIVVNSTNVNDNFIYTVPLDTTGNYRAVITYTATGSGGADDTIEDICTP